METKISKSATSCTNTAAAPFELENQQDVQGDTSAQYLENFGRYLPGPSPSYLFKGWGPEVSRHGIAVCGCTLFLLSGYNCSLMGSVSSVASYRRIIGLPGSDDRSELLSGTINGLFWVGVMAGTLLVGKLADYAGRRKAIVIACILGVVIVPILTALQNYAWALVARILNGVAAGALDSACLTWSAETAHHKSRGRTIGLELACSAYGAGMTLFAIYGLSRVYGDSCIVWRLPIALQIPLMFIIVAMVPFLPESPRWLVKVGLIQDARNVVAHMHPRGVEGAADIDGEGGKEDRQRQAVDAYIASIQQALLEERLSTESMGYLGMLVDTGRAKMARRTWSTLFIQFAAQFMMGGGIVSAIGMGIFETGGWPTSTSTLMAGCTFLTVASFGIFGASVLAETVGRRRSLWIGPLVGTVLLALMGMAAYYVNHYIVLSPAETKKYAIVVAALQFLWGANFGATWIWTSFTYPSELFPTEMRARGNSFSIIGFASGAFLSNMIGSYMFHSLGYGAFFLLCGENLVSSIVCYLWMPDTTGKTLEEIDHLYD